MTYGAGGSTRQRTREVVTWVRRETTITPMAHLTCQGHTRDEVARILEDYRAAGIENVLALGGDPPTDPADHRPSDYTYASSWSRTSPRVTSRSASPRTPRSTHAPRTASRTAATWPPS